LYGQRLDDQIQNTLSRASGMKMVDSVGSLQGKPNRKRALEAVAQALNVGLPTLKTRRTVLKLSRRNCFVIIDAACPSAAK
jgi:hypothetical protein